MAANSRFRSRMRRSVDESASRYARATSSSPASAPHALSARNTFEGRIVDIKREGRKVMVNVDAGVVFEVHITPSACEELHLEPGKMVWLVIKTYSCNLVEPRK